MSLTKARRSRHQKIRKSWRAAGPISVLTSSKSPTDDYLIDKLEAIIKHQYKEEGRREALVDQKIAGLEEKVRSLQTAMDELTKNLSMVVMLGKLINSFWDWIRAKTRRPAI